MARTYNTVGWQDGTVLQPAKVTIQGVDYDVQPQVVSGTTPVNATNLKHMDNEIKKIIEEDIPSVLGVPLIAVSDTAPDSFSTGDKYYNTVSDKIFTAEDSTTWDDGVTPTEGIVYIVFDSQNIYMYNGETLVSVGGGAGGETLPVGSEIDFDGSASDIPIGWEQVDYTLYESSSGTTGNVTLSDSVANYTKITILYRNGDGYSGTVDVLNPNGQTTSLILSYYNTGTSKFMHWAGTIVINGTTITHTTDYYYENNQGTVNTPQSINYISILKVVGYK